MRVSFYNWYYTVMTVLFYQTTGLTSSINFLYPCCMVHLYLHVEALEKGVDEEDERESDKRNPHLIQGLHGVLRQADEKRPLLLSSDAFFGGGGGGRGKIESNFGGSFCDECGETESGQNYRRLRVDVGLILQEMVRTVVLQKSSTIDDGDGSLRGTRDGTSLHLVTNPTLYYMLFSYLRHLIIRCQWALWRRNSWWTKRSPMLLKPCPNLTISCVPELIPFTQSGLPLHHYFPLPIDAVISLL